MAKKQDLGGIFAKTEDTKSKAETTGKAIKDIDLDRGNIRPLGIGLRAGEVEALQAIADKIGVARNALTRWLIRWAIEEYKAGRVDPGQHTEEPKKTKKLKIP